MNSPCLIVIDACLERGFHWLDVSVQHSSGTARLPLLHSAPYDRLLIAQATRELMRLLTRGRQIVARSGLVPLV